MKSHLDNLMESFPSILSVPQLDLGAGRGSFMIEAVARGANIRGIEYKKENIEIAQKRAGEVGTKLELIQGRGEELPYGNDSFGFINICEVIEHVESPQEVLKEVYRVLRPGGEAYLSVPNRFGLKDQHFHLYFINWLPRGWSDKFISIFRAHKDYEGGSGLQRLREMHYYTFAQIRELVEFIGFQVYDVRQEKIELKFSGMTKHFVLFVYIFLRFFFFDSFHVKLVKKR